MPWSRNNGIYSLVGEAVLCLVAQKGDLWISRVYCNGVLVDCGEWDGREAALRNAEGGMKRAVSHRRFDAFPPELPEGLSDDADEF